MGDYRNELQSALSQVEALRAENASLRARLRAGASAAAREDSSPGLPPPTEVPAPRRSFARQALAVAAGCVLLGALAMLTLAPRRAPPEAPLRMPDAPTVPVRSAPTPLPMPPTTVRLPERPKPAVPIARVIEEPGGPIPPSTVRTETGIDYHARWQDARRGLYVLTTLPEAECTVGGVLFQTPRPVFLEPGDYTVRCEAGHTRHLWQVRIAAQRVTFDLEHRVGQ